VWQCGSVAQMTAVWQMMTQMAVADGSGTVAVWLRWQQFGSGSVAVWQMMTQMAVADDGSGSVADGTDGTRTSVGVDCQ
jgi:hypothetical protein